MSYSTQAIEINSFKLSASNNYTPPLSWLQAVADALDMEVVEYSTPRNYYDGQVIITHYVKFKHKGAGFYIYCNPSSTSSFWFCTSDGEKAVGTAYGCSYTSAKWLVINLSADIKILTLAGYDSCYIFTTGVNSDGEERTIVIDCLSTTQLQKIVEDNITLQNTFNIGSYTAGADNYIFMAPRDFPASNVYATNLYQILSYSGALTNRCLIEVDGYKYLVLKTPVSNVTPFCIRVE